MKKSEKRTNFTKKSGPPYRKNGFFRTHRTPLLWACKVYSAKCLAVKAIHICVMFYKNMTTKAPPAKAGLGNLSPSITWKLDCQTTSTFVQETVTEGVLDYATAILNDGLFST